jgi:hypothetical protein
MGYEQEQAQAQGQQMSEQGRMSDTGHTSDAGRMSGEGRMSGQRTDQGQMTAQGRDYQPADRDYQAGGRHQADTGRRSAVIGGTALAGTLMLLSGLWMVVVAIVALSHGHVFSTAPAYTFRYNIRGWGWTELALGILIFAAGMSVFLGMAWARYVGAFIAVLSAIASFVFIPYQPLWSIVMIALDAFIIWALLTPRTQKYEF